MKGFIFGLILGAAGTIVGLHYFGEIHVDLLADYIPTMAAEEEAAPAADDAAMEADDAMEDAADAADEAMEEAADDAGDMAEEAIEDAVEDAAPEDDEG